MRDQSGTWPFPCSYSLSFCWDHQILRATPSHTTWGVVFSNLWRHCIPFSQKFFPRSLSLSLSLFYFLPISLYVSVSHTPTDMPHKTRHIFWLLLSYCAFTFIICFGLLCWPAGGRKFICKIHSSIQGNADLNKESGNSKTLSKCICEKRGLMHFGKENLKPFFPQPHTLSHTRIHIHTHSDMFKDFTLLWF